MNRRVQPSHASARGPRRPTSIGRWLAAALVAAALPLSGCLSSRQTVYRHAERVKVEFESEQAARVFYETLSRMPAAQRSRENRSEVHIPLVLKVSRTEVVSENAAFNEAVGRCDTNKDGKVIELEARIFAEQYK